MIGFSNPCLVRAVGGRQRHEVEADHEVGGGRGGVRAEAEGGGGEDGEVPLQGVVLLQRGELQQVAADEVILHQDPGLVVVHLYLQLGGEVRHHHQETLVPGRVGVLGDGLGFVHNFLAKDELDESIRGAILLLDGQILGALQVDKQVKLYLL